MAKETEQQTMEEYLLSQLDTPVVLKDGTIWDYRRLCTDFTLTGSHEA